MMEKYLFSENEKVVVTFFLVLLLNPENQATGWGTELTPPAQISPWMHMRSQDDSLSFISWQHGLNSLPVKVDVQVKPVSGPDQDFIFPGIASAQRDSSKNSPYGGILYKYNQTSVLLYAPNNHKKQVSGYSIFTGGFVWKGPTQQQEADVLVRVRIWGEQNFPKPDFNVSWTPIKLGNQDQHHNLGVYPELVVFQYKLGISGFVADGIGYLMRFDRSQNWGAVLYAYNDNVVRIWRNYIHKETFVITDGWGRFGQEERFKTGNYRIFVWKNFKAVENIQNRINPSKTNSNIPLHSSVDQNCDLIQVMVKELPNGPNMNAGFLFKATGAVQSILLQESFSGVAFSYSNTSIRAWYPPISQNSKDKHYFVYIDTTFEPPSSVATKASLEITTFKLNGQCTVPPPLTAQSMVTATSVPPTASLSTITLSPTANSSSNFIPSSTTATTSSPFTTTTTSATTTKTTTPLTNFQFTTPTFTTTTPTTITPFTKPSTTSTKTTSSARTTVPSKPVFQIFFTKPIHSTGVTSHKTTMIMSKNLSTSSTVKLSLVPSWTLSSRISTSVSGIAPNKPGCNYKHDTLLTRKYDAWIWFVLGFGTCLVLVFLMWLCWFCAKSKEKRVTEKISPSLASLPIKHSWNLANI